MKVGTGIGIAALIVAVLGMIMPGIGLFVAWVALIVACVAALFGDKALTIATLIVSIVGFVLFTPSLWLTLTVNGVEKSSPSNVLRVITIVLLIAPVVCMILNSTGRLVLGKPNTVA
jgi:hypothetical protein